MGETLLDKLKQAKREYETAIVIFMNDGTVEKENYSSVERMNHMYGDEFYGIERTFCDATKNYSRDNKFDAISMNLLLGLIYNVDDIDADNNIKDGAEPINGIVRYYTDTVKIYKDNKKINNSDDERYRLGMQGFIKYDKLVSELKKSGLIYLCPRTFEEFKEKILSGESFDIMLSADLEEKEKTKPKQFLKRR